MYENNNKNNNNGNGLDLNSAFHGTQSVCTNIKID